MSADIESVVPEARDGGAASSGAPASAVPRGRSGLVARPIDVVCLDMAGTTVADGGLVEQAFLAALDVVGVAGDDSTRGAMLGHVRATMGTSKITVFRSLLGEMARADEANRAFEQAYGSLLDAGRVAPLPGAVEAVDALRSRGTKVALCTGFSRVTLNALLDVLGWRDLADLAICPSDVGRGRPYPDMVLAAAIRLGASAMWSVAVAGDTAADMESGARAGASVVAGVLTGADRAQRLVAAGATHVLASVAQLPGILADR